MLLLRTFPLSFGILWRYVIVLPILLIAFAMMGFLAVFWGVIAGFFSIYLSLAIIMALIFTISMVPLMTGIRLGLQAKGITVRGNYGKVMLSALGYGLFEAIVRIVITFGVTAALIFLSQTLTFDNFIPVFAQAIGLGSEVPVNIEAIESDAIESDAIESDAGLLVILLSLLPFALLRAAFLPAFAGGAACADPGAGFHTPFVGFGRSFLSLSILVIILYLAPFLAIPAAIYVIFQLGLDAAIFERLMVVGENIMSGGGYEFAMIDAYCVGGVVLFSLWLFSLQCAGAVLSYQRQLERLAAAADDKPEIQRMDPNDLRDLVRSRMPERKY